MICYAMLILHVTNIPRDARKEEKKTKEGQRMQPLVSNVHGVGAFERKGKILYRVSKFFYFILFFLILRGKNSDFVFWGGGV